VSARKAATLATVRAAAKDHAKINGKKAEPETDKEPRPFRLRLRHRTSPRTKMLTVGATSEEDARAIAEESLGEHWELLEIRAA
jgi:hypothetical protein